MIGSLDDRVARADVVCLPQRAGSAVLGDLNVCDLNSTPLSGALCLPCRVTCN